MAMNIWKKYRDRRHKESSAYRKAEPIIAKWAAHADFAEIGDFKTLRIFRKAA